MDPKHEFHFEEYRCLRSEINNSIEKIFMMVQFVPVASAAMVAWLATNSTKTVGEKICLNIPTDALSMLWKVRIILGVMGLLFSILQMRHVFKIGDYLRFLEEYYGSSDERFGWERRLQRRSAGGMAGVVAVWVIFIAGCLYYAYSLEKIFNLVPQCLPA
jgi:hypothetical protein